MDPKQQFLGRLGTLGGLGTLAATGNPDAQGRAAGLGTLGGLGTLAATENPPLQRLRRPGCGWRRREILSGQAQLLGLSILAGASDDERSEDAWAIGRLRYPG